MHRKLLPRTAARSALLGAALVLAPVSLLLGQGGAPPDSRSDQGQCFGFAFGSWTPALNWQAAGHGQPVDSARIPRAPNGRGWAALDVESQSDTTLLLFPPWWPAGIVITYGAKPKAPGDTVPGRALALVADGRKQPPVSSVRLWQVPCGQ